MLAQQFVTDTRPAPWLVKRNDYEIWQGPVYGLDDFRFIGNFTDNFNVGLVGEGCEDSLPHETGTICHEDPDGFFHGTLPAAPVSSSRTTGVRIKSKLPSRTTFEMGKIPMETVMDTKFDLR